VRGSGTPRWRTARGGAALGLATLCVAGPAAAVGSTAPDLARAETRCVAEGGQPDEGTEIPWAQGRLDFERVHRIATGKGVVVAVADSGIDPSQPQTRGIDLRDPQNVITGFPATDVRDCDPKGHGTGVISIIAGQPLDGVGFVGLAPDATIMPIKEDDPNRDSEDLEPTIDKAINSALASPLGVRIINLSLEVPYDDPAMREAVIEAGRRGVVIVAASGNQGDDEPTRDPEGFPAAYADDGPEFAHVLAVGSTTFEDTVASTSTKGDYVGVVAPGDGVWTPTSGTGYRLNAGTSFAAPFVSATAALLLERFPDMTAPEVVNRIKATADPPGVAVPDDAYGYGVVNPYVALTAERSDARLEVERAPLPAVAAPDLPEAPDRTLQNIAYAVAAGLLGSAAIAAVGSAAWRRTRDERSRAGAATD
jgi:membrane-anchored mycosin MYCP